jgi:hypothetical protein
MSFRMPFLILDQPLAHGCATVIFSHLGLQTFESSALKEVVFSPFAPHRLRVSAFNSLFPIENPFPVAECIPFQDNDG